MSTRREAKTYIIGIGVTRDAKSHRDKISGILRYAAQKQNWNIVFMERNVRPAIRIDAQILLSRDLLRHSPSDIPTVTIDQFTPPDCRLPNILVDNRAIGAMAAAHFLRRGLDCLAAVRFLSGGDTIHSQARIEGFVAAAAKAGITASVYLPATSEEDKFLSGSESFRRWLKELPKPCGVFCFHDQQARNVLDSCRLAHLTVPDQVAIIGVDNETEVCEMTRPSLSSIQPDFEAAGYLAAKVLDGLLSHRKVQPTYAYGILQLVERESTRSLNAGGLIVSAAMRLIRTTDAKLTVAGLAAKLRISTTFLNRRFNEIIGYGPKQEIDRQRILKIQRLLRDPSLSVAQIADLCHFSYPEELHLFFRRHTGLTPTEWRRQGVRG